MSRYMPLTDVDHPIPTILIDTHAPLDALHATADYRIRIVTQLLETLTSKERTCNDPTLINDLMGGIVILLRDGCDVLDVMGRRLRAQRSVVNT